MAVRLHANLSEAQPRPRTSLPDSPDAETDAELDTEKDGHVAAFAPRAGLVAPDLAWLLSLSEADFRRNVSL